jgi:hypothetical protein
MSGMLQARCADAVVCGCRWQMDSGQVLLYVGEFITVQSIDVIVIRCAMNRNRQASKLHA